MRSSLLSIRNANFLNIFLEFFFYFSFISYIFLKLNSRYFLFLLFRYFVVCRFLSVVDSFVSFSGVSFYLIDLLVLSWEVHYYPSGTRILLIFLLYFSFSFIFVFFFFYFLGIIFYFIGIIFYFLGIFFLFS
jgi:hypothetical protein